MTALVSRLLWLVVSRRVVLRKLSNNTSKQGKSGTVGSKDCWIRFHYSALKAQNDIPAELCELPTLDSFKKQLKIYFISFLLI